MKWEEEFEKFIKKKMDEKKASQPSPAYGRCPPSNLPQRSLKPKNSLCVLVFSGWKKHANTQIFRVKKCQCNCTQFFQYTQTNILHTIQQLRAHHAICIIMCTRCTNQSVYAYLRCTRVFTRFFHQVLM